MKIIPTILAFTPKKFEDMYRRLLPVTKEIHIDVMDGKFVPTKSIPVDKWPNFKKNKQHIFEAHLMVEEPQKWIPKIVDKGVKRIIVHIEPITDEQVKEISSYCKLRNVELLLAIKSITRTARALRLKPYAKGIMLMGVIPGKNKSPFIEHTVKRVQRLRKQKPKLFIQVDGGANQRTAKLIKKAGANVYNSGSYVSLNDYPKQAMKELQNA